MKAIKILLISLFLVSGINCHAAIVKGTLTTSTNQTLGSGNLSIPHSQDTGSNGLLIVTFSIPSSVVITDVTYNSVSMTLMQNVTISSVTYRVYYLASPDTGLNNVVISTNTAFALTRTAIQSFTGAILGTNQIATTGASPVTDSITVSENSRIYLIGMYNATSANSPTLIANGITLTKDYQLQFVYTFAGALSLAQTAGSKSVECSFPTGSGNLVSIELEESGGPPPPATRRIVMF